MRQMSFWKLTCAALLIAGLVSFHSPAAESDSPPGTEADTQSGEAFMQAKLKATHEIVDGLAFEDFTRIERGADELLRVAELASWKVRRDPVYMHYAMDFEETALRLRDAARRRSVESATFAYMHLTVSCTACHQHVRNVVQVAPARGARFESWNRRVLR